MSILFVLAAFIFGNAPDVEANVLLTPQSAPVAERIVVPEDLSPEQVGEFIAPLSEQQVRNLLIKNIQRQAILASERNDNEPMSVLALLKSAGDPESELGRGIKATIGATQTFSQEANRVFNRLTSGQGFIGFLGLLGLLILSTAVAAGAERLILYRLDRSSTNSKTSATPTIEDRSICLQLLFDFLGLIIFAIAGFVTISLVTPEIEIQVDFVKALFGAILIYRLFTTLFKLALYPAPYGFTLIDDRINRVVLYYCMAGFTFAYAFGTELVLFFAELGLPIEHTVLAFMFLFGLIVNPIVFWFVWTQREDIDRIMFGRKDESNMSLGQYPFAARAKIWPSVITFIVTLSFVNWQLQALTGNTERQFAIEIAWWLTILFPLVDLLVSSLLYKLAAMEVFQSPGFERRKHRFTYIIRSVVRFVMLTVLTISFLEAWGYRPIDRLSSSDGISILSSIVDIGVTILLGFIIWEAIQFAMERYLPDPEEEELGEIEGEGGGIAATRSETLLPLFRTILLILLFVIVLMSILYSLGVQIGPLLAGASVVGIAIGFGSQKLVQDIISGMFFLIDDAFRRGEYVEVAGLRGTIEKLSVRSMQLRHHLGAVQTVPYGEINTVKNNSRDWVIMKLELRLPYDVDIEKVRKIIKKIGQEMVKDEITGPMMLQPLKSQGVMRVEESALIVRMKFTAKPGEQWIVRRTAYTRVRDALAAAGIEFAHREIKVRMPGELEPPKEIATTEKTTEPQPTEALASGLVGAAALSAVLASELDLHGKIGDDEEGSDGSL